MWKTVRTEPTLANHQLVSRYDREAVFIEFSLNQHKIKTVRHIVRTEFSAVRMVFRFKLFTPTVVQSVELILFIDLFLSIKSTTFFNGTIYKERKGLFSRNGSFITCVHSGRYSHQNFFQFPLLCSFKQCLFFYYSANSMFCHPFNKLVR